LPLLFAAGFDSCVAVEARQSVEENAYLFNLLDRYEQIKAVVGWWICATPLSGMNWTDGRIVPGSQACATS
jgi:L-fuconolactonase